MAGSYRIAPCYTSLVSTKYVVTMTWEKRFTGFCTLEAFEENRELYLDPGDTYEVFDGPDPDGTREAFNEVKQLAIARCVPAIVPLTPQLAERMSRLTEGVEINPDDPITGDVDL